MRTPTVSTKNTTTVKAFMTQKEMASLVAQRVLTEAGFLVTDSAVDHVWFQKREIGHSGVWEWEVEVTVDNAKLTSVQEA